MLALAGVASRWHTRLHATRVRFGLRGLVQIHHLYPREFRHHAALRGLWDIDDERNLVLMPTREGARQLRLRPDRLIHDGGHPAYNRHVGQLMDAMAALHPIDRADALNRTLHELRAEMRRCSGGVPWV